jgi:methionyl-tRNA formyltransferase
MKNFMLISQKHWHRSLFKTLSLRTDENWQLIMKREDFTNDKIQKYNPSKIFIPHWSHIIPAELFENYECIVFHMTDLPYGRGGSPLQNLIVRGHEETMISALKVSKGIDTGDIYLKAPLSLAGTAQEIFLRSSEVIQKMITSIIDLNPVPLPQEGNPVNFRRRKPEDSDIGNLHTLKEVFDYIRMLDCEGYPHAFLETEHFRFEFNKANLQADNSIKSDVRIIKK